MFPNFEGYQVPDWDEFFMRHVYLTATKSKDNRSKIGSILVKDKNIISGGYNGICRSVNDDIKERHDRPEKYFWFEHSERNAIYDCARRGASCLGSTLYTQGIPCSDCSRGVIQAGISDIVVHAQWQKYEKEFNWAKWDESAKRSEIMLNEAGIKVKVLDKTLGVVGYLDGKIIDV